MALPIEVAASLRLSKSRVGTRRSGALARPRGPCPVRVSQSALIIETVMTREESSERGGEASQLIGGRRRGSYCWWTAGHLDEPQIFVIVVV